MNAENAVNRQSGQPALVDRVLSQWTHLWHRVESLLAMRIGGEEAEAGSFEPVLTSRVHAKRQRIWQLLLADRHLLVTNHLEVRHLITYDLVVVAPETPTEMLHGMMVEHQVHHLLVCKGEKLVGLVSDRDLMSRHGATAGDVMSKSLKTVTPETTLGASITTLVTEGISCLPVMEDGHLLGMLTTTDLVLALQCTLSLWHRVSKSMRDGLVWSGELDVAIQRIDEELFRERDRVAKLEKCVEAIASVEVTADVAPLVEHAERFFASTIKLGAYVGEARDRLLHDTRTLMELFELGEEAINDLPDPRELVRVLDLLLAINARHRIPLCVVMISIDMVEPGPTGLPLNIDAEMIEVLAQRLRTTTRDSDFLAHYDDATFVVVLTHATMQEARNYHDRVSGLVRMENIIQPPARLHGAVVGARSETDRAVDLLSRLEQALLESRRTGQLVTEGTPPERSLTLTALADAASP